MGPLPPVSLLVIWSSYAHSCALFFDGDVVTEGSPRTFFSGNSFYTISANRMARALLPEAITAEDETKTGKLPWWRILLAVISGAGAIALFIQAMGVADLSALVQEGGLTHLAGDQLIRYGVMIACLLVFAFSVSRKSVRPDYLLQTPLEKRGSPNGRFWRRC